MLRFSRILIGELEYFADAIWVSIFEFARKELVEMLPRRKVLQRGSLMITCRVQGTIYYVHDSSLDTTSVVLSYYTFCRTCA